MLLKLYNLLNEVIFEERMLLSEGVSESQIMDAIDKRYRVKIKYQGEEEKQPSERLIDVYAYGYTKAGNKVIRVYQSFGGSKPGGKKNGWKFLRLDRILNWEPTKYFLYKDKAISDIDSSIPRYNRTGDKTMSSMITNVKFTNNN